MGQFGIDPGIGGRCAERLSGNGDIANAVDSQAAGGENPEVGGGAAIDCQRSNAAIVNIQGPVGCINAGCVAAVARQGQASRAGIGQGFAIHVKPCAGAGCRIGGAGNVEVAAGALDRVDGAAIKAGEPESDERHASPAHRYIAGGGDIAAIAKQYAPSVAPGYANDIERARVTGIEKIVVIHDYASGVGGRTQNRSAPCAHAQGHAVERDNVIAAAPGRH
ncbi:MAG: hypothetical protein ACRYF5_10800, partial [Janthinobacterium lividum]